jgi:hypothetical protein
MRAFFLPYTALLLITIFPVVPLPAATATAPAQAGAPAADPASPAPDTLVPTPGTPTAPSDGAAPPAGTAPSAGHDHTGHAPAAEHGGVPHEHMSPSALAYKQALDKWFSELNYRIAGVFLFLTAVLVLLDRRLTRQWPALRGLWAAFLFLPGLYLFFFSDPEAWPLGEQSLGHIVRANREVLEHKIFAVILMALGTVELLRAREWVRARWAGAVFPALAGAGAFLLVFHTTGAGYSSYNLELMARIHMQYLAVAAVGVGIAVSKVAWDAGWRGGKPSAYVWPALMMLAGLLLVLYRE